LQIWINLKEKNEFQTIRPAGICSGQDPGNDLGVPPRGAGSRYPLQQAAHTHRAILRDAISVSASIANAVCSKTMLPANV